MILYPASVGAAMAVLVIALFEIASWRKRVQTRRQLAEECDSKTEY